MSARRPDEVFVVAEGASKDEPRAHLLCKRCGDRAVQSFPIRVDTWLAMSRAFTKLHAKCKDSGQ